MKSSYVTAVAAGLCFGVLGASLGFTQSGVTNNPPGQVARLDERTSDEVVRVSQLIGQNIHNTEKEHIGKIEDIVLDADTMKVQYAAVSYGGFLGFGNKLFAVPLEAIKFAADRDDREQVDLVMNISADQLDQSEGFDKDHWPNGADEGFEERMRIRYGVDKPSTR